MMNAWRQREKRDGLVLKWIDMDFPIEDDDLIYEKYVSQFTAKTQIVHITHVINWVGQVIPTKRIADEARKRGIEVIVDGAHSFAQMDYNIPDLGADYYATSLHKWLCAPFGTGMMWIRKDKIKNVWALLSAPVPDSDDIRKFENLGTRHMGAEMAIGYSLDFHNSIGTARKRERLLYLRNYWMRQADAIKRVSFYNSYDPKYSCALSNIKIEGMTAAEIDQALWRDHKIHTVGIKYEGIDGVRITPNIYTSLSDLDRLVTAIEEIAKV
jgi:selenocysteine lyase/cysteine desulfurase